MEINDIRKLLELMEEKGVVELEMKDHTGEIRLVRENHRQPAPAVVTPPLPASPPPTSAPAQMVTPAAEPVLDTDWVIASPMVGTFYRAPNPDVAPYVEVGTGVEKGDVVCIIEAMKMMNEIQAEQRGRVLQILVENGQPVEYGQPLFQLEPV